jgi:predicted O-methyltransferase YrrM
LAASVGVFIFLWGEGRRANQFQRPNGIVLGELLVLAGIARLALRLIAGEHPLFDAFSIARIAFGALTLVLVVPRFTKKREEHHIIERVSQIGEVQQPEYTPPTEECPHPGRWTMMDSMSAEVEVLEFLKQVVLTLKPELIVETGTFIAASTIKMAEGLRANGSGKVITCEFDPLVYAQAKERVAASGLQDWIECRNQSSLDMEIAGTIDLFFSDSHLPIREEEIRRFLPQINPNGLILMHDTSSHYKIAREAAFRLEQEGLISMVVLPTPRGLMMAQKRSGRK